MHSRLGIELRQIVAIYCDFVAAVLCGVLMNVPLCSGAAVPQSTCDVGGFRFPYF